MLPEGRKLLAFLLCFLLDLPVYAHAEMNLVSCFGEKKAHTYLGIQQQGQTFEEEKKEKK